MLFTLRQFFSDSDMDETELERVTKLLKTLFKITIWFTTLSFGLVVVNQIATFQAYFTMAIMGIAALVGWGILIQGYIRLSGFVFHAVAYILLVWVTFNTGGINAPSFTSLIILIFYTGLIFGRASALIYTGLLLLAGIGLFITEQRGNLPPSFMAEPRGRIIINLANIAVATAFVAYATNNIKTTLSKLRQNQTALEATNQELQHEIIERRQAETQLLYHANLLDNVSDAIISTDMDFNILSWNVGATRMYGWADYQVVGKSLIGLLKTRVPNEEPTDVLANQLFSAGSWQGEVIQEHQDGSLMNVLASVTVIQDSDEQMIGAISVNRDITALRRSEAQFRDLFEFAPIGMIILDLNGRFVRVNPAACNLLGYTRNEFLQLSFAEITHPDDIAASRVLTRQLIKKEVTEFTIEKRYIRKNGEIVYVLVQLSLLCDALGQPQQCISQFIDLTDHKQTEEALRQTQKLESLGILAGGIAHDFNNLLTVMLAQASLIQMKLPPKSPVLNNIDQIIKAAERAANLTQQMLAYSGRGRFEISPININALILENMHLLKAAIPKQVALKVHLAHALPFIDGDIGQIQQVIMNLIINGAEAIENGSGTVTITTQLQGVNEANSPALFYTHECLPPGDYVTMVIRDDGIGLNNEVIKRIFDPFFTTKTTGRGLGLAAVLGIVHGHNGGLQVESELGVGTTFRVFFPVSLHQHQQSVEAMLSPSRTTTNTATILVIDDEAAIREIITAILADEGIKTLVATNGSEGVVLYQQHQTDITLVILDLSMPGLSGEETLKQLQQINPNVAVLLSSGYSETETVPRFTNQDIIGFLQKPYQAHQLLEIVQQNLASSQ